MYLNNSTVAATVIADRLREADTVRRARGADARDGRRLQAPLRSAATWIALVAPAGARQLTDGRSDD